MGVALKKTGWGILALACLAVIARWVFVISEVESFVWNNERLAAAYSLFSGYRIFYGMANDGPLLSWSYGPLGALAFVPAALSRTALAMKIGMILSLTWFYLPAAIVFLVRRDKAGFKPAFSFDRICAFVLFCLLSFFPASLNSSSAMIHVDAPALGLGLLALFFILGPGVASSRRIIACAFFAVAAVFCKQSLLPILVVPATFLFLKDGAKCALVLLGATGGFFVCFTAISVAFFGADNLSFLLFSALKHTPWHLGLSSPEGLAVTRFDHVKVALSGLNELVSESLLPVFLIAVGAALLSSVKSKSGMRARIKRHDWILPALMAGSEIPFAVLGRIKAGGANNCHSVTTYFLSVAACLTLCEIAERRSGTIRVVARRTALATLVILLAIQPRQIFGYFSQMNRHEVPVREGLAIQSASSEDIYFPQYPIVSLLARNRLYHSAAGVTDRDLYQNPLTANQVAANLPHPLTAIYLYSPGTDLDWRRVIPFLPQPRSQARSSEFPNWIVLRYSPASF